MSKRSLGFGRSWPISMHGRARRILPAATLVIPEDARRSGTRPGRSGRTRGLPATRSPRPCSIPTFGSRRTQPTTSPWPSTVAISPVLVALARGAVLPGVAGLLRALFRFLHAEVRVTSCWSGWASWSPPPLCGVHLSPCRHEPTRAFYVLPTCAWELGAGAICRQPGTGLRWLRRPRFDRLRSPAHSSIAAAMLLFRGTTPFPGLDGAGASARHRACDRCGVQPFCNRASPTGSCRHVR